MNCPYCNSSKIIVLDKRKSNEGAIRRRRECVSCKKRFTTYEKIEVAPLIVIKKDGRREEFDRNKVLAGMLKACEKRPISREKIEKIVDSIENELRNLDTIEIKSRMVGELVMNRLRELDDVAYIRFASVYRRFKDLESFERELRSLKKR